MFQIVSESLGSLRREADILVHVEGVHALPLDPLLRDKRFEQLVLRRGRGKKDVDLALPGKQPANPPGSFPGRVLPHLRAGREYPDHYVVLHDLSVHNFR